MKLGNVYHRRAHAIYRLFVMKLHSLERHAQVSDAKCARGTNRIVVENIVEIGEIGRVKKRAVLVAAVLGNTKSRPAYLLLM